jgi:tRNA pseudouridine55 synthase
MDGIINIYKPRGITSYDVIRIIKKEFNFKDKIGHGGTLDPIGEGVLII